MQRRTPWLALVALGRDLLVPLHRRRGEACIVARVSKAAPDSEAITPSLKNVASNRQVNLDGAQQPACTRAR
ncbi:hypothetical protein LL965_14865 [Xanthomonas cassavae CFBP 4642]|uniref:Secreted protein n=1 Tax=Xanthomonas cassavae CFBP 4642 TaxID=1219375 RepID=A0ABS8HGJ4_9XANT|nr:hypothetical protein [Xanthomonas cassavae]MCC4621304.1 hypothetical protein [Xanthomonas cassavae CFBP 4642]